MDVLAARPASPNVFPMPKHILQTLRAQSTNEQPEMVLAEQDVSVSIAAYVPNADIVAHRVPTTSEIFPANQQDAALQRLIDQDAFFNMAYLTPDGIEILQRYGVDYVIAPSGTALDLQLRLAQPWLEWVQDDQSFSLYQLAALPEAETAVLLGNAALAKGDLDEAAAIFDAVLAEEPANLLALAGMAEVAQAQGRFEETIALLSQAAEWSDVPGLYYRLGQLQVERGEVEPGIRGLQAAVELAPAVSRFHEALGNVCLIAGDVACAEVAYTAVITHQYFTDEAARRLAEGDLWRRQGFYEKALPLYEQAGGRAANVY